MSRASSVPVLVTLMLITGVCNTLLTKYQDMQCVADCETARPKLFEQPVLQTLQMFVGEAACWLVVLINIAYQRLRSRSAGAHGDAYQSLAAEDVEEHREAGIIENEPYSDTTTVSEVILRPNVDPTNIVAKALTDADDLALERQPLSGKKVMFLAGPAICDILGTTLMNVGLLFLAASIYQMLRGTLILFVGLFSVLFLKRHLSGTKWASLFVVVAGVAVVGLAGALGSKSHGPHDPDEVDGLNLVSRATDFVRSEVFLTEAHTAGQTVLGLFLIAVAQLFSAGQFVLEESIMERYAMEPIQVVGWEGVFGFTITLIAMGVLHAVIGQTPQGQGGYFDAREGFYEVFHFRSIGISSILIMISIGGFNFFGISVTRRLSATARSTIDTCRTLGIWVVSLGLGWETFKWLQVLGFVLLVYGTFLFNDIVRPPTLAFLRRRGQGPIALESDDERA